MKRLLLSSLASRRVVCVLLTTLIHFGLAERVGAHPASGILVDANGNVFFVYTGHGVMRVLPDGKIACIAPSKGGHWLCPDFAGSFSRTQPKYFARVTADGVKPGIIFADGGAPIAVCNDGNLYYASGVHGPDEPSPGGLTISRMTPQGKITQFALELPQKLSQLNEGITGLAAGADGSLFAALPSGVLKIAMNGEVSTVVHPVVIPNCDDDPPDHDASRHTPSLRGLAVDPKGVVFAPATSCHRVIKITPDGAVSVVVTTERPWSPTAVALHDGALYILEYTNANGGANEDGGWVPRIRKLDRAGKLSKVAVIEPPAILRQP